MPEATAISTISVYKSHRTMVQQIHIKELDTAPGFYGLFFENGSGQPRGFSPAGDKLEIATALALRMAMNHPNAMKVLRDGQLVTINTRIQPPRSDQVHRVINTLRKYGESFDEAALRKMLAAHKRDRELTLLDHAKQQYHPKQA